MINVGQLKKAISALPDDMPVLISSECGARDGVNLYVVPAHIEHSPYGSHAWEDHRTPSERRDQLDAATGRSYENCSALLISEWGSDGLDITPQERPGVVDGEVEQRALGHSSEEEQ